MANLILCVVLFSAQVIRCITHPTAAAVQHEWSSAVYASHWDAITCRLSWSAWHGQWWPGTDSHCMLSHCYFFVFSVYTVCTESLERKNALCSYTRLII